MFSKLFLFPVTKAIILQWQQPTFNTYNLTKMASERNVGNACYHSRYDTNLKFLKLYIRFCLKQALTDLLFYKFWALKGIKPIIW